MARAPAAGRAGQVAQGWSCSPGPAIGMAIPGRLARITGPRGRRYARIARAALEADPGARTRHAGLPVCGSGRATTHTANPDLHRAGCARSGGSRGAGIDCQVLRGRARSWRLHPVSPDPGLARTRRWSCPGVAAPDRRIVWPATGRASGAGRRGAPAERQPAPVASLPPFRPGWRVVGGRPARPSRSPRCRPRAPRSRPASRGRPSTRRGQGARGTPARRRDGVRAAVRAGRRRDPPSS